MKSSITIGAAVLATLVATSALLVHGQAEPNAQPQPQPAGPVGAPIVVTMTQPGPQTALDAMLATRGVVVVRGYTDVGNVQGDDGSGLSVAAVELSVAKSSDPRQYGLAVGVRQPRGLAVVTNVDADELDALLSSLDTLGRLDATATPLSGFEARFKSKADLEFSNFADGNGSRVIAIRGTQVLPESGQLAFATAYFPLSRLPDVKQLLASGKQTVDKARNAAGNK